MFRKYSFSEQADDHYFDDWGFDEYNQESNSKLTKKKQSSFTQEEDDLLFLQVEQLGKKWKKIATLFPNKTDKMLRNRYIKLQQQSETEALSSPKFDLSSHEIQERKKFKVDNEQQINTKLQQLNLIKQKIDLITVLVKQTRIEMITLLQPATTQL